MKQNRLTGLSAEDKYAEIERLIKAQLSDPVYKLDSSDIKNISSETNFANDLGFDSLDRVELVMSLENLTHVQVPDAEAESALTVGQMIQCFIKNS